MRRLRTFVALCVAVSGLALGLGTAAADGAKVPIRIESRPSGAKIYLENRESDPLGTTPYKGSLEEGSYTLIVELEGYEASVQPIKVKKKGKKALTFTAELEKMRTATLDVRGKDGDDSVDGARILVDGVEQGNVPDKLVVPAAPHQIEVVKDGFKSFEVWVEPSEGEKLPIDVVLESDGGRRKHDDDDDDADPDDDDDKDPKGKGDKDDDEIDIEDEGELSDDAPRVTRGPIVVVDLKVEMAGRTVSYVKPNGSAELPYSSSGIPMGRFEIELYPLATFVPPALSGLGIVGSVSKALPVDSTTSSGVKLATTWAEFDIAGRYQFRFGGPAYSVAGRHHVGVEVGFGGQTFDFTVPSTATAEQALPETQYKYMRYSVDGRFSVAERIALYVEGSYRQVSDVGKLFRDRYASTLVTSYAGGAGIGFGITPAIEGRLDGNVIKNAHTYQPFGDTEFNATSGSDVFWGVSLSGAFRY